MHRICGEKNGMSKRLSPNNLAECLEFIRSYSVCEMDLSLDRVIGLAGAWKSFSCPIITVAGTNGKGTTAFTLESIYRAGGYRTGLFTSPFLFRYPEQIRVNGEPISESALCEAFSEVEKRRGDIPLTPFEYLTLAALWYFQSQSLAVLILEVGLGGRLDAVNVVDADLAIITNISLDHTEYLGDTLEKIAIEKAGILRAGKPFVYSEKKMPNTLREAALAKDTPLYSLGHQFDYQAHPDGTWDWRCSASCDLGLRDSELLYPALPKTHLHLDNLAGVLMGIQLLQPRLPLPLQAIQSGIQSVNIPGRIQTIQGKVLRIFDVSHNPASIAWLAESIFAMKIQGKMHAVFSMLSDKNIQESVASIQDQIDDWYVAPIQHARASSLASLKMAFSSIPRVHYFENLNQAYQSAMAQAQTSDAILIFGSFHTVSEVARDGLIA